MKQSNRFLLLTIWSFFLCLLPAQAGEMNYQGRLTDANGNPLTDGAYIITFRIYNAATSGTLVWGPFITDGNTGNGRTANAQLVNGRFNVVLGPRDTAGRELSNQFLGGDRYLEIQIAGSASPISPRQKLLHAPLALHADTADHATTATAVGSPGSSNVINIQNNRVGINTDTPATMLHINGSTDAEENSETSSGVLMIGNKDSTHLILDNNEIIARTRVNNILQGSTFYLNSGGTRTELYGSEYIRANDPFLAPDGITVNGMIVNGVDNDGTNAAIKIAAGFATMLIDGNEIGSDDTLFLNNNSSTGVQIGGSSTPDNDGSSATLKVTNGSYEMLIDGNEIDTDGSLFINRNSLNKVQVGDIVNASEPSNGTRLNVNSSGYSNVTLTVRGTLDHTTPFIVENFTGGNLARINTSGQILQVYGDAGKSDGGAFWGSFSDRRLKTDIHTYSKGLAEIKQLETVTFHYIDDKELGLNSKIEQIGLIAQDVQSVFPEAISEQSSGYLNMNINAIQWASINAIQELAEEASATRAENAELKKRLTRLEAIVEQMHSAHASN